jgi:hypothetical protein
MIPGKQTGGIAALNHRLIAVTPSGSIQTPTPSARGVLGQEKTVLARVLFLLGIALLAMGGWLYYDSLQPRECSIEQPEREVSAAAGQTQEVIFQLTNPTNQMVRIVGLADC